MSTTIARTPSLEIGRVLERQFGVIGRNAAPFFAMAAIVSGGQAGLVTQLNARRMQEPAVLPSETGGLWGVLIGLVASTVLQAIIVYWSVHDMETRRRPRDLLAKVAPRLLPIAGVTVLGSVGIGLGLLALIVPGVLLMLAWIAAGSVAVVEGRGVFESFSRSLELTRGRRAAIFALVASWFVLAFLVDILAQAIVLALDGLGSWDAWLFAQPVASTISSAVTEVITATGMAAIYFELRRIKDGDKSETVAAVFD